MKGILDLLQSDAGRQIVKGMAQQTGQNEQEIGDLLSMAMPVMM